MSYEPCPYWNDKKKYCNAGKLLCWDSHIGKDKLCDGFRFFEEKEDNNECKIEDNKEEE